MKRLSIARKFYPRLRYIRINISKLLAALLQVGMLQSSLVQSTGLPIVMAGLVGVAGTAHAEVISGLSVGMGGSYTVNWMDTASNTVTQGVLNVNSLGITIGTTISKGGQEVISNAGIDGKDHSLKSSINNTGVDLAVYGHQSLQDDLTLSVIAKTGYTRAKASRIDDTELPVRAKSSQDIWHLNLAAELVKTIVKEQLTLSPVLGLEYGSAWVSGYQESGAGYYSLNTERQQAESLIASIGSRVRYQLNDKAQLLGYASVGYDALARASHLRASTEDHRFSVTSADPGNIVTRLGLAYEWRAKAGNYLRANYDYQGRDKGYRDNMLRLDWIVVW